MSRPSQARAPGKVILLGEHSVVYGQPALALPLDRGVTVRCEPAAALRLKSVPAAGAHAMQEATEQVAAQLGNPLVEITIDSDIPLSAGLGSSAAVAVALTRALAASAGRTLPDDELLRLAEGMEQTFHGRPSGIDHTTCALAAPLRFVRGPPHQVTRLSVKKLEWVVALSGPRQGTKEKVLGLRQAWEREPERIGAKFAAIGQIVEAGQAALLAGDERELGRLFDANQAILAELGLTTPAIDALLAQMRGLGAYGAKLTGAGGGGAVIALHPEPAKLVRALEQAGVRAFAARWEEP